jgi:hypothetical protein
MPSTPTKFFSVYDLVSEIDLKRHYTRRTCDLQERLHKQTLRAFTVAEMEKIVANIP